MDDAETSSPGPSFFVRTHRLSSLLSLLLRRTLLGGAAAHHGRLQGAADGGVVGGRSGRGRALPVLRMILLPGARGAIGARCAADP